MSSRLLSSILDLRNIVENYDTKGPVNRAKRTKDFSLYFDVSPATGRDAVIVKASHAKYPRVTRRVCQCQYEAEIQVNSGFTQTSTRKTLEITSCDLLGYARQTGDDQ